MKKFIIIENQEDWYQNLINFVKPDCYYAFDYGKLFARIENGKLFAAYYEDQETKIFYPFIKRNVPYLSDELYDIVTPYGYGGPLIKGSHEFISKFYELFSEYCRHNNIITETIRFHPLNRNYNYCKSILDVEYIRKTAAVDLTLSLSEIRDNYSKMNKRNINKARKSLSCFVAEKNEMNIKIFLELYKETMDRNNAASYYYFDDKYFKEQLMETDSHETLLLMTKFENEVIAGAIVLLGKEYSHYHLGASRTKYLDLKPNNLLFDFMIETCKGKGSQILHLGGGYKEDDGLFKFKASFSSDLYEYYIGKKVHLENRYLKLINQLDKEYHLNNGYFPIYRAVLEKKDFIQK